MINLQGITSNNTGKHMRNNTRYIPLGFSLVEMAIVLVIFSILMAGLLAPLAKRQDSLRVKQTQQQLAEIKQVLLNYAVVNRRFPCPDIDVAGPTDGLSTTAINSDCAANYEGELPWAILGVGQYDSWAQPFRYRLDTHYELGDSDINSFSYKLTNNIAADNVLTSNGNLQIVDLTDRAVAPSRIVAIIFSCGDNERPDDHNASGATATNSCANANSVSDLNLSAATNGNLYTQQIEQPATPFDDILVWITEYELMSVLQRSQQFPLD